jgi:hypothetical protein
MGFSCGDTFGNACTTNGSVGEFSWLPTAESILLDLIRLEEPHGGVFALEYM